MYRIADLKNSPRCLCCGCVGSLVKPSHVRFRTIPGAAVIYAWPELLCPDCSRWAMLWGIGQAPAADDLVTHWMTTSQA